jgi:hypothetical protein
MLLMIVAGSEGMGDRAFGLTCDECGAILREIRDALPQDEQALTSRLRRVADASGRAEDDMRLAWVSPVASAPADEMQTIMRAQCPRIERSAPETSSAPSAAGIQCSGADSGRCRCPTKNCSR